MATYTLSAEPGHIDTTGTAFMVYGRQYQNAAKAWLSHRSEHSRFDVVSYHLVCQSLELHLKSFIWLIDRIDRERIKRRYGHDLTRLWTHAKSRGISKYARITAQRDAAIALVAPYHRQRKFNYLDVDMIIRGYSHLKQQPNAIPTILRLAHRIDASLRTRILEAS